MVACAPGSRSHRQTRHRRRQGQSGIACERRTPNATRMTGYERHAVVRWGAIPGPIHRVGVRADRAGFRTTSARPVTELRRSTPPVRREQWMISEFGARERFRGEPPVIAGRRNAAPPVATEIAGRMNLERYHRHVAPAQPFVPSRLTPHVLLVRSASHPRGANGRLDPEDPA